MPELKIIEIKQSIFADNDADAERLREQLKQEKTFLLNLMSSPGSGKTSVLMRTIDLLKAEMGQFSHGFLRVACITFREPFLEQVAQEGYTLFP